MLAWTWATTASKPLARGVVLELFPSLPPSSAMLCSAGWDANGYTVYGGLAGQSGQRHACLAAGRHGESVAMPQWRDLAISVDVGALRPLVAEAADGALCSFVVVVAMTACRALRAL